MASSRSSNDSVLEPGPPGFSEIEGRDSKDRPTHHPGASTVPGAGPNPTAADAESPRDTGTTTPGASNTPGAGANPDPGK
jgi:hypothetical protein